MKSLRSTVVICGLIAAAFAGSVSAAPLLFNFAVRFTNGPLNSSQFYFGTVTTDSTDCPGNICSGIFTPGNVARTLLSFDITIAGIHFGVNNDSPPAFPEIGFDAQGHFNFINYDGIAAGNELIIFGNLNTPAQAAFDPAQGLTSTGIAFAVPEPGTVPLLGGALLAGLAFGWIRRKRTGDRLTVA